MQLYILLGGHMSERSEFGPLNIKLHLSCLELITRSIMRKNFINCPLSCSHKVRRIFGLVHSLKKMLASLFPICYISFRANQHFFVKVISQMVMWLLPIQSYHLIPVLDYGRKF